MARDFLARQAVAARKQVLAIARQEVVRLAENDLQAMPLEVEVANDLRIEQADRVARRRVAKAGRNSSVTAAPPTVSDASSTATFKPLAAR